MRKIGIHTFIMLIVLIFVAGPAHSQDDSEDVAESSAPEVVVTGKRAPEDPFLSDRSISALNKQALAEAAPRNTPEALWDAPGVFVQATNYGGGSPIVRGLIGPQVLIMVDGVRLNNSTYRTGPVQYLNTIDNYSIERVEVLRGPGSVLYGSDAMGGVIQVFPIGPRDTRNPDRFGGGGTVAGRFSSADYGRAAHAHADAGYGAFGVLGGGTYKESDNLIGGRDIGEQIYSGYESWAGIGRMSLNYTAWGLNVGYLFNESVDVGRTDKLFDKQSLSEYDNRDQLIYAKLRGSFRPINTEAILTASYQGFFERKDTMKMAEDLETKLEGTRDETEVGTIGADLQLATRLFNNRLRFLYGGMWYGDQVDATREKRDSPADEWVEQDDKPYPDGSTYDNYGAFFMTEGDPLFATSGHTVRLSAGARLHGMKGSAPAEGDLPEVDFDHQGTVFLAGAQYLYRELATLAFTFSQGFRSPNLQEAIQLGNTGKFFHIPNDELEPETADTYEAVARAKLWRFKIGAAGYITYLEDLIKREETTWEGQSEIDEIPVVHNVNGGKGTLQGVEPQLALDIGWGLSLAGHMTYTWGEEERDDGTKEPLTRIPPLYGQGKLRYDTKDFGGWRGFAEFYARGAGRQERLSPEDTEDSRIPEGGTPEWLTWNLRTGLAARDNLRLGLTVENLTNVDYKYHASGVSAPGTNAILSAELGF
jgi:outer membrane receptor protein involved in Fe transport